MVYHWVDKSFDSSKLDKYRLDIHIDDVEIRLCASKLKSQKIMGFAIIEHTFSNQFDSKIFLELTKSSSLPFSKKYGEVSWVFSNHNFSLVPSHLVDKEQIQNVLGMNALVKDKILMDEVAEKEITLVSGMDEQVLNFVQKHFPGAKVKHFSNVLFKVFRTLADQRKATVLYFQNSTLYIGLFDGGEVQFLNAFEARSSSDILYFLGGVVQMNDVNREKDPLLILGEITKNGELVDLLKKYFKDIIFPTPYLVSQDASLPHKQPNHYFSGLFNQRVCV